MLAPEAHLIHDLVFSFLILDILLNGFFVSSYGAYIRAI